LKTGDRTRRFWTRGEPFVWVAGAALTLTLLLTLTVLLVVLYNGLGVFWLDPLLEVDQVVAVFD